MLMVGAHVGHDCVVGNQVVLVNNAALAGEVTVGDRAFISAGVGVHQFCRVGRVAMIGGLAKVVQDALPFVTTDGNPARARGLNLVGLRRAGFKAAEIAELKDAYRMLYQRVPLKEAIERMKKGSGAAVKELAEFLESGKRGFAHPQE
jgi:UDP-N-acetylglucosamine acyltransferase